MSLETEKALVEYKTKKLLSDKPLVRREWTYVLVSHRELDTLIARLMHIAELDSDKEHREALKGELKRRARDWLDDLYADSGYVNHALVEGTRVVDILPKSKEAEEHLEALTEVSVDTKV